MIVHYRYILRTRRSPAKTDAPLLVNSNAVLTCTITSQLLKSITGRNGQVTQLFSSIENQKFPHGRTEKFRIERAQWFSPPHSLRRFVAKRQEHTSTITQSVIVGNTSRPGAGRDCRQPSHSRQPPDSIRSSSALAKIRSRSRVACWYRRAASVDAWPALSISSAVVAPVAAANVRPV